VVFGTTDRGIEALRAHECDMKISFEPAISIIYSSKKKPQNLDRINRNYKYDYPIEKVVSAYDYPIEKVVSAVLIPELTEAE
jgi:hypothetical protein